MNTHIEISSNKGIEEGFVNQVRRWANEVLEKKGLLPGPPYLCINIWKNTEELQAFYQREKEALGILTGEETEFFATHEAWRGYPRIHVCQERVRDVPAAVVQGVLHHEVSHALHHGTPEFYTFRFSKKLQEVGRSCGMDLPVLQQCAYFLSIAIKDNDVAKWLTEIGLGFGQLALIGYLLSDTEDENKAWEVARDTPALKKITIAALFKILLPIEGMISMGMEEAPVLKEHWNNAYLWLPEKERTALSQFAKRICGYEGTTFQERLEQATLDLITDPSL